MDRLGLDRAALRALPPAERRPALEARVRQLAARALGAEDLRLGADEPLTGRGLDSLSALELEAALESELGAEVALEDLLGGASIADLAGTILADLARRPETPATDGASRPAAAADAPPGCLSHGQRALWFLDRLAPAAGAYNLAAAARLRGGVQVDVLRQAFARLLDRHAALRTAILVEDGEPRPRVVEGVPLDWREEDAAAAGDAELRELLSAEAQRAFDLGQAPLLRLRLYRRGEHDPVLLVVVHHAAADFWSLAVLVRELGQLYDAGCAGLPSPLAPIAASYRDFAAGQREMLAGPRGAALWEHWQRRLADEPPPPALPLDRPRPPVQTWRGGAVARRLAAGSAGELDLLARDATAFTALLAAFASLLHRYSGSDDLQVGSPTANRGGGPWSEVVGYFVNPVVLRLDLSGRPSFAEVRERASRTVLEALAWQDLPFALLAERLHPQRGPARSPLFQVLLVAHRSLRPGGDGLEGFALGLDGSEVTAGGLRLSSVPLEVRAAPFDLTLAAGRPEGDLAAAVQYNADLFDRPTAERLLAHLETLLAAAAAHPELPVADLPWLSVVERQQLLREWNQPAGGPPSPACLHQLVLAQARETPRAVALVHGSQHWTYDELRARSEALAERLRELRVGPEIAVAIALDRCPEMVAAMLATLAAGGFFVALPADSAAMPAERMAWILDDTRAAVLLTRQDLLAKLPPFAGHVLCVDGLDEMGAAGPAGAAGRGEPPAAGNLAYAIYTSGSTGRPKGVAIEHHAAVALVRWALQAFGADELDGVLAATSISFDLTIFELFVPLSRGGKVILAGGVLDLPWLPAAAAVTLVNTVPSAMSELMRLGRLPAALAAINLAGEALPRELAEALFGHPGVRRVRNLYGPSETTTYSTWAVVGRGDRGAPPIGRPIAGTRAHVLDGGLRPLPAGVAGELYLGGDGLARGYLGRPDLTAERFVPDPLAERPGERLYRTGDLARRRADGTLEFLGRIDQQAKLRGFRIEPGEIEAALLALPEVAAAAVVVREDTPGLRRLVGYVVTAAGAAPRPQAWREALLARLPDYMVPAALVSLPALPLTPHGKLDRRALPPPPSHPGEPGEQAASPPQGAVEEELAAIWEALLAVERVGAEDDFFVLGGHSLLAARVTSRIGAAFGVELPLRALFEAPTLRGLARRVETAMQERRGGAAAPGQLGPVGPMAALPRTAPLPLSFAQQRLWFLEQLERQGALYNLPLALRLSGELAAQPLAAALTEIVRRHEVLRTVYAMAEGQPEQRILPPAGFPLPRVDLAGLRPGEREAAAAALVAAEAARPFDLAAGPVLRGTLLRLGAREHVLQLTLHHIAGDGWSVKVVATELASLYAACRSGLPSPLPELPLQYADFALWQRRWLTAEALAAELAWWRPRLADLPPVLELPLDRPRPAQRGARGGQVGVELGAEAAAALARLGRRRAGPGEPERQGATLFMLLLAAFAALLSRFGGQRRIVVGAPIAGRRRPETEGLAGCFVNTLALPIDLTGDPGFRELVGRVREVALGAYAHQDLPFEALVEAMQPERTLAHAPLVQVVLALQNEPFADFELAGLRVEPIAAGGGTAKFDLTLSLAEPGPAAGRGPARGGLAGTLDYDRDLFDAATVRRLWRHLETLIACAAADPELPITSLPLLAPEERQQLREWNATAPAATAPRSIHACVAAWAACAPDAVAVAWIGPGGAAEALTYGQLDARADRLARDLRRRGVGPEARVGICLERSPEMVVGLLGVLKAGGAYLPLDPTDPPARRRFMIEDARPGVVLTRRSLLPALTLDLAAPGVEALCLEDVSAASAVSAGGAEGAASAASAASTAAEAGPDQLAYVMYTSGSTGVPKAVAVPHRAVVRLVRQAAFADLGPDRVFLQLAPLAFDASTFEIWGALANGGRLALFPAHPPDARTLGDALERHGVTTLWLTAGLFHQVVEDLDDAPAGWRGLRELLAGGDVLSPPHVRRALSLLPGIRLVNGYGPTENTTFTCCHRMSAVPAPAAGGAAEAPVPIGRPIAGTFVEVWDRRGERAPVGVPGELMAGGAGLARGYLGRPELTAERFVPDPAGAARGEGEARSGRDGTPGARLYRTGDLVRWRADGTLEFLGRLDQQVKVRGFRVEPGEIEGALLEQPGVAAAAVTVREDSPGERRLVAYLVPAVPELRHEAVRAALRARLPAYMVPAAFVTLAALPLTPAGKVDRRALPAPSTAMAPGEAAPLQGPVEELVAGIWSELLRRDAVGADEDFFALGGHSLLATRVMARLRAAFGVELPLRELFAAPTVRALARQVEQRLGRAGAAGGSGAPPPILPAPRRGPLPLSYGQERLWFLDQLEPGNASLHIALALRLTGRLAPAPLAAALAELGRRHESLRTVFRAAGGEPRQVVLPPAEPFLPLVDLGGLPAAARQAEASRQGEAAARRPFDLAAGPLLRPWLLRMGAAEHLLRLDHHHAISDGWSVGVLVRELGALYEAFAAGRPSPLRELPVQYADYAVWQRTWLAGETLQEQLAYWRRTLAGDPPALDLPTDRPRPAVQTFHGAERATVLPPELSDRVHALGRRHGATPFMTLLAAVAALLGRWSGQQDVLIGAPIAGRRQLETEGLIGFFLNSLVLRTDLAEAPSFEQLLARVREATLGAFTHQDVPFEAVLADLQPERDLSRTPLFQVFLNLLNLPPVELHLPGLAVEPIAPREMPAKFDMTFYAADTPAGLRVELVYNAGLFDAARMEELLGQLALLLEQAVARPEAAVAALSLVTARARGMLPDPAAPLDATWQGSVHGLFAARAAAAPGRLAIADREGGWSYGELHAAADLLAGWLAGHGVGRGDTVAIWAHRSAPIALAVLGVLEAGAAFTILDPAYPAARLATILELAKPRAWVRLEAAAAVPEPVEAWLAAAGCPRLDLPGGGPQAVQARLAPAVPAASAAARPAVGPDDPAVVGFTSGSSGTPKGIVGRHGPLSHFLPWQCRRFSLSEGDRFSLLSGLAHDPLQRDLFTPLYLGAAVIVPDPEDVAPGRLAAWMAREGVTVAHLTPAMAQLLTERPARGEAATVPSLRRVLLVGDALTRRDVARIHALAPGASCINLYGSTETQRAVAYHLAGAPREAGDGDARGQQVLPLGRGMQDVQLLVVTAAGLLAGVAEVGEIAVRSPHLALGYLGDAELTAAKFAVNPWTGAPADRIYRTGDLGRYLPDGEVAFAGRADQQVKIRGFRVEPAEIEAVLGGVAGVREAVVLARPWRGELRLCAYVVPERPGAVAVGRLREAVRDRLPVYMLPAGFALLERLPLTPNGKVDRRALARLEPDAAAGAGQELAAPRSRRERQIAALWRELLGVETIGVDDNFFDLGGHSLLLVRLHSRLQELLGRELPLIELFRHPTVRTQAAHLGGLPEPAAAERAEGAAELDGAGRAGRAEGADRRIAIVGMAGRFPGAPDLETFWHNLQAGVESISRFSDEELATAGVGPALLAGPRLVRALGMVAGEDLFDAGLFGLAPRQAEMMDPQFRVFLECAWEALESAGCDPRRSRARIGVYGGVSLSTYFLHNLATRPELLAEVGAYQVALGTDRDYLTAQVSYRLGLNGPSADVQTACSTSLFAAHLACQALLAGDCDLALAGGSSIRVPQVSAHPYDEGGIESPRGRCRAFDAGADGTVNGCGAGIVVLKRLADALADGDTIHAVVLASAVNNDGALKMGLTAPSLEAQARVVSAALGRAGVPPDSIGYVEAHGTGTALGDPIEVAALTQAFRAGTDRTGFCPIGSVKTNIGHLGAAAGVAGLIKTVLALEHRQLPPSLHFETPNPRIDFASSPFYVNGRLAPWRDGGAPRRAGVSAFGLAGTNVHFVVEEAPPAAPAAPARGWQLLLLSAADDAALAASGHRLAAWLEANPETPLADAAWTLQTGRRALDRRLAVVCRDGAEALAALAGGAPRRRLVQRLPPAARPVVLLFPGQGAQHPDMGRGLYEGEALFRDEVDAGAEHLLEPLGRDLRELLYPPAERREAAARELRETRYAQPALVVVELALARLWLSWGVTPRAMLGHSVGEYAAACLAGVMSREDALDLVAARGDLIQRLPPGVMLAVDLPEAELAPLLGPGLSLAAINAPRLCVAAGPEAAVAELEARLAARRAVCRRLHTSHAFHSAMLDPVLGAFAERVARVPLRPPSLPYLSSLTGDWIEAAQATDPSYWVRHLRATVRFGDAAGRLLAGAGEAGAVFLELGPGRTLGELVRQQGGDGGRGPNEIIAAMRRPREAADDVEVALRAAGRLWLSGIELDWQGVHAGARRRRIPLPTYPFQRRRYWVDPAPGAGAAAAAAGAGAAAAAAAGKAGEARAAAATPERPGAEPWPAGMAALPPAGSAAPAGTSPLPSAGLASRIAAMFEALLGVDGVGADDDFFELGGQSLLGTRLLSRLRDELDAELSIDALFDAPTPAALAQRIAAAAGVAAAASVADAVAAAGATAAVHPLDRTAAMNAASAMAAAGAGPAIVPLPRGDGAPLSFAQERLWFLHQLAPESAAYNLFAALLLAGRLDVPALAATFGELVRRHEALRTTFGAAASGGEGPVQRIAPPAPVALPFVALDALPAARARAECERLARAVALRPHDLARGPVLRAVLAGLGSAEHALLAGLHHIAGDGWSLQLLEREVAALYAACAAGRPSPLPDLPVQYADFAAWQRGWLQGERLAGELAWWRGQLAGAPPALELPADRPRPPVSSDRGAAFRWMLPADLAQGAAGLGRRFGATLFMVALATFQELLGRLAGGDDVLVGTPVANRTRTEIEGLIGCFVNTLVLRARLAGDRTFGGLLGQVRQAAVAAFAHQDLPFEKLVEGLVAERDLSRAPLFQVMLVLQDAAAAIELPGLRIRRLPIASGTTLFDLTLTLAPAGAALAATFEYATDLFDAATVGRWAGHFRRLLGAAVADPLRPLAEVSLLSAAERHQLLHEWNAVAAIGAPACVHRLLAAQALRTPDAVALAAAVGGPGTTLSYRRLLQRVDRLARRLRRLGAGPEEPVGVCVERSPEQVIGFLGALASGGAYLPLDPALPRERLAFLLADSGARLVIARGHLAEELRAAGAATVVLVDGEAEGEAQRGPESEAGTGAERETGAGPGNAGEPQPASDRALPENLACILYTSGSTGRPKGVGVPHAAAVRHALDVAALWGLTAGDRVAHLASPSFDLALEEVLPALLCGAAVVVGEAEPWDPATLLARAAALELTVLDLTTAYWDAWVRECASQSAPPGLRLRLVAVGGEAMAAETARLWRRTPLAGVRLLNSYGPTEAVVAATWQEVGGEAATAAGTVAIGKPPAGRSAHVLDRAGQPLPAGVPGELHLGGALLARGYLRRPDLTAERFVPDPFAGRPGERLYRSGDLARRRVDGTLEFLGRTDAQVKLRGFRVEPGEIEAALRAQPGVAAAAVTVREVAPGGRQLVAYVVPAPSGGDRAPEAEQAAPPGSAAWRAGLRRRLPDHMVPAVFVTLAELPLTPHGKVDRAALPAPGPESSATAGVDGAPRTPAEELLAGIWAEVLRRDRVSVHDDFFALGGQSLLATQVVSRVRRAFGVELAVRELFEAPTVALLAARLAGAERREEAAAIAPAPAGSDGDDAKDAGPPLSFAQERLWFLDQLQPGSWHYNIPWAALVTGPLAGAVLARCLGEVVRRHEVLAARFPVGESGEARQVIARDRRFALPRIDLAALPAGAARREARRLARQEARLPFDLGRGPLLRARLVRLAPQEHALLVTLHHVVADAWSLDLLIGEVARLYAAFAAGLPSPLPELPIQYADFARWQRRRLGGARLAAEVAWWREQLAGVPAVLELPADRPRPPVQSHRGRTIGFAVPAGLTAAVRDLARRHDATVFMVLLAAFQDLLFHYTGRERLGVGTPVANRTQREVEGLIGLFVNTLVLPADLAGDPPFAELLGRTRRLALGAYQHQELPFERLVDALAPSRDLSRTPLVQVVLVLQHASAVPVELPGLALRPLAGDGGSAKFDLTLTLSEVGEDGAEGAALAASCELATDLFDGATVHRWSRHFLALLAAAAADPGRRLSDLPLLEEAERHQLQREWSDPLAELPSERSPHLRFAAHARSRPHAEAAACAGRRLTYGELDAQANRLARHLRGLAAWGGTETLVGIFLERSLETVVAILGVLKAGGAYLPLDPAYPADRLAWILEDAGAPVLLTSRELYDGAGLEPALARLAARPAIVRLDADGPAIAAESDADPGVAAAPDNVAYVIYTSGSTGRPKGVQVTHRNVARLLTATARWFGFGEQDVWTLFHSYAFDFSVWELWGALAHGGRLVVVPYWVSRSPEAFHDLLCRERVTVLNQTPSAFQLLQRTVEERSTSQAGAAPGGLALRWVIFGGEALEPRGLAPWFHRHGDRRPRLVNMYGITETTVHVTYRPLAAADAAGAAPGGSRIGVPIPDLQLYLLDAAGRVAPMGVTGEIHVGGAGVARGYLGRPELTAERFVPDPFSGRAGARLYRSGDLARHRPPADLEYLGRTDHQVKVRGFRIELGEIEAVLASHPGVREVVVLARPSPVDEAAAAAAAAAGSAPAGERRLVAYVVTGPGAPSPADLRAHARERLPEYLVPAVFVPLPALPLTVHGKVDRAALPEPGRDRPERMAEAAAPRTPVEELLAAIWAEVLGSERVGVHDNFFDLGGDSILSIQIVARARRQGLHLEPRHLFEHQTVAELAAAAVPAAPAQAGAAPEAVTGALPLTPIQRWFLAAEPVDPHHWNQSLLLAMREPLRAAGLARLAKAAARLVAHHDALRLRLRRDPGSSLGPGPAGAGGGLAGAGGPGDGRQWMAAPGEGPRPFSAVDLAALPATARTAAVESCAAAAQASLDLAAGPIARFVAFGLGAEQAGRLLIVVHHWAIDGVSWRILLEDLASAWEQAAGGDGGEIALPPKTTSYRDWALHLQERSRAAALERELPHWRELAAAAAALPRLAPAGDGGGEVAAARTVELALTAEETRALLREVPAVYHTRIDEVLLAALARAVATYTRGPGLLVDLEGHGREDAGAGLDLSRTVGWFTALYPVALQLADPADPGGCLQAVKEQLRRVPERGVGYGLLRYLRGGAAAAELAALPPPEIAFNYLGQLDQALPAAAPFVPAAESRGAERSPRGRRPHLVEVGCSVALGVFRSTWTYDSVRLAEADVRRLAAAFLAALRDTAEHCRTRQGIEYAPSDFPEAALSEQLLARALAEIEQE